MKFYKNKLFLALLLIITLGIFIYFDDLGSDSLVKNNSSLIGGNLDNILEDKKRWSGRMDDIGTEAAYAEFKMEYASAGFEVQHTIAHTIGQLIYEKEDINGLTICDSTFAFGCYHSFFTRALAERGPNIVADLDKTCIDKFGIWGTGCQHGIGHGLMEYFGPDKLSEALKNCRNTTQKSPLLGCTSGVFMEFNTPIIISEENTVSESRKTNPQNPYLPCNEITGEFQISCYYELAQWWAWNNNPDLDYSKLGLLCDGVSGINKEACFMGIGSGIVQAFSYDMDQSIDKCSKMPSVKTNLFCRSGAAWTFFANPEFRYLSSTACQGLSVSDQELCIQRSDLTKWK